MIGLSHIQDRDYARTIPYLMKAVGLDPAIGSVYCMIGMSNEEIGNIPEAITAYDRMIELGNAGVRDEEVGKVEEISKACGHYHLAPYQIVLIH